MEVRAKAKHGTRTEVVNMTEVRVGVKRGTITEVVSQI